VTSLPCDSVLALLKPEYRIEDLSHARELLRETLRLDLTEQGFLQASARGIAGSDPTHYDAVWVRDSVWGFLALKSRGEGERARACLLALLSYFGTSAQRLRLASVIHEPLQASRPAGEMKVLHVRFDPWSKDMADVHAETGPQLWNHKQNDALALAFGAAIDALADGFIDESAVPLEGWDFLLRLPTYFDRLAFESMEDAGAWEEIERINTSSIGLVTAALEKLDQLLTIPRFRECWETRAKDRGIETEHEIAFDPPALRRAIDRGYARILQQLPHESPAYLRSSPRYRESDAALLALVYPGGLKRLDWLQASALLDSLQPLIREVGVVRYLGDAYQSANYWQGAVPETSTDPRTDDCSEPSAFSERARNLVPGTEAQWFFDSWISIAYAELYRANPREGFFHKQVHHFNRALSQITGGTPRSPWLGADGKAVPAGAVPESYNIVIDEKGATFRPSPITPLNWAKASLSLALDALERTLTVRMGN